MPEPDLHQLTKRTFHLIDSTYEFGLTQSARPDPFPAGETHSGTTVLQPHESVCLVY